MEFALEYKAKMINFLPTTSFETQISLRTQPPSKISPPKRAFEKYKLRGLFSEFYGILARKYLAKKFLN